MAKILEYCSFCTLKEKSLLVGVGEEVGEGVEDDNRVAFKAANGAGQS